MSTAATPAGTPAGYEQNANGAAEPRDTAETEHGILKIVIISESSGAARFCSSPSSMWGVEPTRKENRNMTEIHILSDKDKAAITAKEVETKHAGSVMGSWRDKLEETKINTRVGFICERCMRGNDASGQNNPDHLQMLRSGAIEHLRTARGAHGPAASVYMALLCCAPLGGEVEDMCKNKCGASKSSTNIPNCLLEKTSCNFCSKLHASSAQQLSPTSRHFR